MTKRFVERIQQLQEFFLEAGLARSVLALSAPRMLAISAPTAESSGPASIFSSAVTEPEIEEVSRDLFASGHYSLAVQEAYKAVEKYVSLKVGPSPMNGTQLMESAFSPSNPKLHWTGRQTTSELDEQKGYQRLYSGAMLGIRNPVTHEFNWIEDADVALELLIFAQHLLKKAKLAHLSTGSPQRDVA